MYDRTYWLDHVTDPPNSYLIEDNGDGTKAISPVGTVMQQGTPQDQLHFNNLECGTVDAHLALLLLLNGARQNTWEIESGTKHLTNSLTFPFNNSQTTVALSADNENGEYIVLTEAVEANGNVGEVVVTDKLTNGFKLAFTGSATAVTVKYTVIGGLFR